MRLCKENCDEMESYERIQNHNSTLEVWGLIAFNYQSCILFDVNRNKNDFQSNSEDMAMRSHAAQCYGTDGVNE